MAITDEEIRTVLRTSTDFTSAGSSALIEVIGELYRRVVALERRVNDSDGTGLRGE